MVPINKAILVNDRNLVTVNPYTSSSIVFTGTKGAIFWFWSDLENGHYDIQVKIAGMWRSLAEGDIEAGELSPIDIGFFIPEARIIFTPAAQPTKLTIEVHGYPIVFARDSDGVIAT